MLASDYGHIRVNYIHGFLERTKNQINRYINARGIEWTNKKTLLVGLSETIIYSGKNRAFEFGYLNPITSHLEVELNNRLTSLTSSGANAVWQIHFDYLYNNNQRISLNYLLDEFVIDPKIEKGKENGKAFSLKYVFSKKTKSNYLINIYLSNILIGTPTFRHGIGGNNFVNNHRPIGWRYGSDGNEFNIGLSFFNNKNIIFDINISRLKTGEETILYNPYNPYNDYIKGDFPSGEVIEKHFFQSDMRWKWSSTTTFVLLQELVFSHNRTYFRKLSLGLNFEAFEDLLDAT